MKRVQSGSCAVAASLAGALVAGGLAPTASAAEQHFQCSLTPASSLTQSTQLSLPLAGTFIGNYDATTNPTGTRTLPGLFGGSGNNAIPYTSTVISNVEISQTTPTGSFELGFDSATGVVSVSKLFMDALSGQVGSIGADLVISFGNFRTVAPNAVYLGVNNLALPLDSGELTRADATQTGAAVGAATPNGDGTWNFAVAVPVDYVTEGSALGQPFGGTPVPAVLALAGTLTPVPGGMMVAVDANASGVEPIPSIGKLTAQPFDMPTYLPPGSTAHLLVSGVFGEGTVTSDVSAHLDAAGTLIGSPGDFNGDGVVSGADLGALLSMWGTPGGDLDGDGNTSGVDLGILLTNWSA
ncbi:MAG: hypothetical protein JNK53_04810 [Phycisphaerae bacterium]|nr:hypothetical protein [Phycisphaerae bacterium]